MQYCFIYIIVSFYQDIYFLNVACTHEDTIIIYLIEISCFVTGFLEIF